MLKNLIQILNINRTIIKNDMKNFKNILNLNIDWCKYAKINNKTYYKNCIYKDKDFEIVVITWYKNQLTKLHNHPSNGCLMKVLLGSLKEKKVLNNNSIKINNYKINDISYIHDNFGKHKIYNNNNISVSIHIYSPPNFYN
tara:strand:- start:7 stop:429 length:423 start_codon:yes stop_codon:yes gene_type:complete